MNSPNTQAAVSNQHSNVTHEITQHTTNQQTPTDSHRTKELRSHPGITIKWSLDSASRRRIGLPPAAAIGAVAPVAARVGGGTC
ncbi:hypothetical protein EV644_11219 [Kribbella orskensis]|uniref:Uncharacterized protein n=1 Tax=Kribbella orskensis TaxID=2512216 RepID=A0ABY2BFH9_9ACTN|nr:hypothetical protein EV642_11319 [Kribbella sp. VKM Ac-2500]TCO18279.1 hypothetical protein EV644_11219 [Kribbella orskensis]